MCLHLTGRSERGIITGICFGCPSSGFKANHVEELAAPLLPAGLSGARLGSGGRRSNDLHPTWESELPVDGLRLLSLGLLNVFNV